MRSKEALELCVLLSEQLLAIVKTERYDWPQLKHRTGRMPHPVGGAMGVTCTLPRRA